MIQRFRNFLPWAVAFSLLLAFSFFLSFSLDANTEEKPEAEKLVIVTSAGEFEFDVEIADTPDKRQVGLMHREYMAPKHGMLFDFGVTQPVAMWMKNTPLPLDMLFIRPDGVIGRIEHRTTPFSEKIIGSDGPVSHVLELNAGMAKLIGANPGDKVLHDSFSPVQ